MKRLVIDTETGGLRPHEHSLLTVGMVLVDFTPQRIEFIDEAHIFIKHKEYFVGRTAMRINGINLEEHHKKGVFAKQAHKQMTSFINMHNLSDTTLLGHNVHFDLNFLGAFCREHDVCFPLCSRKEDTRYIWEGLKRKGLINPFKNAKLGTLAEHFGIDYTGAHDAINDCKITAQVYNEMRALQPVI